MNEPRGACELSVVLPCLNEADTIGTCVAKAMHAMREHGIDGEVIVSDNGSTDGSITSRSARARAWSERPNAATATR